MKARLSHPPHCSAIRSLAPVLVLPLFAEAAPGPVGHLTPIEVPNSSSITVSALNQHGHVAGYFTDLSGAQHPFLWNGAAVDLGTMGGRDAFALDLNDRNQTTGYSFAIGDLDFRAFLGIGRTLTDLGTLGGPSSYGRALNNSGAVTGYSFPAGSANFRAFVYRQGVMTDLGTLGGSVSAGLDINDLGHVIGDSKTVLDAADHAFFHDGTVLHDVGTLGGDYSSAFDLNNRGQVTGISATANPGEEHAFHYEAGSLRDLGTLGGPFSIGYAINDLGTVAGDSSLPGDVVVQGFVWRNGVMASVGHLGSQYSSVWALNNADHVVGVSTNAAGAPRAFLWRDGTLLDLNDTLPPNSAWVLEAAYFINDAGQIVGTGRHDGQSRWYRLELVPTVNQPPLAEAGEDQTVECGARVQLDGRRSSDPDGDTLAYAWFEGARLLGDRPELTVDLAPGVHVLRLRVADPLQASAEDEVTVTVADTQAPQIVSLNVTPNELAAAHRQLVAVALTVTATDPCDPNPRARITQVTSSDPVTGPGDRTTPDWVITGDLSLQLRAETSGRSPRVYTVTVECADASGNRTTEAVQLVVEKRSHCHRFKVRNCLPKRR